MKREETSAWRIQNSILVLSGPDLVQRSIPASGQHHHVAVPDAGVPA